MGGMDRATPTTARRGPAADRRKEPAERSADTDPRRIVALQRQAGNRAVASLLTGRGRPPAPARATPRAGGAQLQRNVDRTTDDPVLEIEQVGKSWHIKIRGFTEASAVAGYLWPGGPPAGVRVSPLVVATKSAQVGLFDIAGLTPAGLRSMRSDVAGKFVGRGMPVVAAAPPVKKTQYYNFDIGPPDPAHPDQIQLKPRPVSQSPDYVDTRMVYLEWGLLLGGFNIYLDEFKTPPIFIPLSLVEDRAASASAGDRIFDTIAEARESVAAYTRKGDASPRHAYYRGQGGVIAPTVFSVATTPRIMATLFEARRQFAEFAERAMTSLLFGAVINKVLGLFYGRALKSFTADKPRDSGRGTPSVKTRKPAQDGEPEQTTTPAKNPTKTPPPPPRTLSNASTTDVQNLKKEGFVLDRVNRDGTTAVYRNPTTGERATITLRRGGPGWINPAWGRARIEAELRGRGFALGRQTRGEGGLLYENRTTGEEIRIMPRPGQQFRDEPIEKHLGANYYRYRPRGDAAWGEHTTIVDKD